MKRILLILSLLLLAVPCWAVDVSYGSGNRTADALIFQGEGLFYGIGLTGDGTNATTVSIYDSLTGTGTLLFPTFVVAASPATQTLNINPPVRFNTGLFIDITVAGGGTTNYVVYYSR